MARDPGSKWWPLPEAGAPDGYRKTQFIVHSTGDNASADRIRGYFANIGVVVESTFIIGLTSDDPTLQIMDSTDNADANVASNQRAIAVEVVGDGTGPFTNWQVRELIRIGRWAAENHPIERRLCPAFDQSGFGWHVMFGSPGPWTTVRKVCPGKHRIAQLLETIFPAIFAETLSTNEDPFMALSDKQQVTLINDAATGRFASTNTQKAVGRMERKLWVMESVLAAVAKKLDIVVDELTEDDEPAASEG